MTRSSFSWRTTLGVALVSCLSTAFVAAQEGKGSEVSGAGTMKPDSRMTAEEWNRPFVPTAPAVRTLGQPGGIPALPKGKETPLPNTPESLAPVGHKDNTAKPSAANVRILATRHASWSSQSRSTIGEPTAAKWGNYVLYTRNWDGGISLNGGASWTRRDPRRFPRADGGFCCDQIAMYVPNGGGMVTWLIQYIYSATTRRGGQRVVVYNTQARMGSGAYHSYYFTPQSFGRGAGEWLDYPSCGYTNSHWFATTNIFSAAGSYRATVCWRVPINQMRAGGGISYRYFLRTSGARTWKLAIGGTTVMYWWQHLTSSSGRLYSWADNSTSISWRTINVASWTWGTRNNMRCPGPDGRDFMRRADSRPTGMCVGRGLISVMWHANTRTGRPRPYTRYIEIRQSNFSLARQSDIWNSTGCFTYPVCAPNSQGYVGGMIAFGSNTIHASTAAWIRDDLNPGGFDSRFGTALSVAGPASNSWGDYLFAFLNPTRSRTWYGTAMRMNSRTGGNANQETYYVEFGRDRDALADLVCYSLTASSLVLNPGFSVSTTARYRNDGARTSVSTTAASIRLSLNSFISATDTLLRAYTIGSLSAFGGTRTVTASAAVPSTYSASGTRYLGAMADDPNRNAESNEGNNTRALRVTVNPRRPDLVITRLTPSSSTIYPFQSFSLTSTVFNQGAVSSPATSCGHYLSPDSSISTRDYLLGAHTTPILARGQSNTQTRRHVMPQRHAGVCYLGAYADRTGAATEAFETNNSRAVRIVCGARADLRPIAFTVSSTTMRRGSAYTFRSTIINEGNATSPAVSSGHYLSTDSTVTGSDFLLGSWTTPILAPSRTHGVSLSHRIPTSARLGTCYVGVFADRLNRLLESQETDNTRVLRIICADGTPDLRITAMSTSSSTMVAGGLYTITSRTHNLGTGIASSSLTAHVVSTNTSITTSDHYVGGYSTGTLVPGASRTVGTRSTIPACLPLGRTVYIGAIADALRQVSELSEANNTGFLTRASGLYPGTASLVLFQPLLGTAATSTTSATFRLRSGPRNARMCVVSRRRPGYWYLLLWSGNGTTFAFDPWTSLGLGLVNSPTMPAWFNRLSSTGHNMLPGINLPAIPVTANVYTYSAWFTPTFAFAGFGSNRITNFLRP